MTLLHNSSFKKKTQKTDVSIIYLDALGLSCDTRFSPWPGIKPGPHALRVLGLRNWTTREVPTTLVPIGDFNSLGKSSRWSSHLASQFGHCKASVISVFNLPSVQPLLLCFSEYSPEAQLQKSVYCAGAISQSLNGPHSPYVLTSMHQKFPGYLYQSLTYSYTLATFHPD